MNWYEIFYWVTVADGVKDFFDAFSNWFTFFTIISFIFFIILVIVANDGFEQLSDEMKQTVRYWLVATRRLFIWFTILMTITWAGYVFCPNKKDALAIIAGGAVGNFVMSDSSSKQIPAELTLLIREKLRSEIQDLKTGISLDTLKDKTKEELIELLKQKR